GPDGDTAPDTGPAGPVPAELTFNPGWIGGACSGDGDCPYEGGFCLLPEEGFPRGTCSAPCRKFCPEKKAQLAARTFCVEDPTWMNGKGICLAQCNLHITVSGCRPGYVCTSMQRLGETTTRMVCLPDRGTPFPKTACTEKLDSLGVRYARVQMADEPVKSGSPDGRVPDDWVCQLDTPVLVATPLHNVDFRHKAESLPGHLLVACPMALALEKLAALLEREGVVEVEHIGTYVCRTKRGGGTLSGHGRGLAIDITALQRTLGPPIPIAEISRDPRSEGAKFLVSVVEKIIDSKIYDVVLWPRNSRTHMDHLHLEIRQRR
ncbi:MAG: hypothetical protein D6806_01665, partial [Deltaproteobacteria bacterium]